VDVVVIVDVDVDDELFPSDAVDGGRRAPARFLELSTTLHVHVHDYDYDYDYDYVEDGGLP
jgi:hypothetical protein